MHKETQLSGILIKSGLILIIISVFLFLAIFYPVIRAEISYFFSTRIIAAPVQTDNAGTSLKMILPVDTDFGIVIPKIKANSRVVADVDAFDSAVYQKELTRGVAHARGSSYPDEGGNIFLFAHSSDNWYRANRYNSVFYLLHKLEQGDEIDIYYKGNKYIYQVNGKAITDPGDIQYLKNDYASNSLILMTCWPPGTDLGRLLVLAQQVI